MKDNLETNLPGEPMDGQDGNFQEPAGKMEKGKEQNDRKSNDKKNSRVKPTSIPGKGSNLKKKEPLKDSPRKGAKKIVTETPDADKSSVSGKKNPTTKKSGSTRKIAKPVKRKLSIHFFIRFHTHWGQSIYITSSHPLFGNGDIGKALPMQYWNAEYWTADVDIMTDEIPPEGMCYNYVVKGDDGSVSFDWGNDKKISRDFKNETVVIDAWNFAGFYENAFYTEPFQQVLLKNNVHPLPQKQGADSAKITHTFRIKAPLLHEGQRVFIAGNVPELGTWGSGELILLDRKGVDDYFSVSVNLSKVKVPVAYKYGIYEESTRKVVRFEDGPNRQLSQPFFTATRTIVNDGFIILPANGWKGTGIAIPVFSLRSGKSYGVGDFSDLRLLVDWAKKVGMKLVQILPVNDTTATHTWTDSYPYAAISAFALHPLYLDLEKATPLPLRSLLEPFQRERERLNRLDSVDYESVIRLKWDYIRQLYPLEKQRVLGSEAYKHFFEKNRHWLTPYAAFCYLRDRYDTSDFNQWHSHKTYEPNEIETLTRDDGPNFDEVAIHYFVQYQLHEQLQDAALYAHNNGIILKGDIPIGIYRYGADAWQSPGLYHMDMQAGAPPDDFAVTGQNWGFPTYNWEKMRQDGFAWWKQRLEQMSYYFDAFRIDHILGFFRIWSIPYHSVEGIMGHFEPAIPVHINEFNDRGIAFDYNRYCRPFINDAVLNEYFGDQQNHVRQTFLNYDGFGHYQFKPAFATQRMVETHFSWLPENEHSQWLKRQLFQLLSNVLLFEATGSDGTQFHFRFSMQETLSFRFLDEWTRQRLNDLYVDYFFRRQDHFWMHEAMQKLPALKRATNMLVCGEDLGLVPASVPEVMRQTGILSLEIQRMPKDPKKEFFHPADAPYLSVVTPSTHDMSTIRGWWEEDRHRTQRFYNNDLGQWGEAPYFCDAWVNEAIIVQHLYSPAMWAVFQLQDILGMDAAIRRPNPHEERINVPANPRHYWKYRMHMRLEDLLHADRLNSQLSDYIRSSGRA